MQDSQIPFGRQKHEVLEHNAHAPSELEKLALTYLFKGKPVDPHFSSEGIYHRKLISIS
jgi:hypothetical protein